MGYHKQTRVYYVWSHWVGKPFEFELAKLSQTIEWALDQDAPNLLSDASEPRICIGSGGSMTAATFASSLERATGKPSWAATPMEYIAACPAYGKHRVLVLTARGNNRDINLALKTAIEYGCTQASVIVMARKSKIADLASHLPLVECCSYDIPTGKDGFLATNTLIATTVLLARGFKQLPNPVELLKPRAEEQVEARPHTMILFGGWGSIAAIDLESKLTEAALSSPLLADFRNFGHGRHHWLAKRSPQTSVLSLETGDEVPIASRTLKLLPVGTAVTSLRTPLTGPTAAIRLLIDSFHIVHSIGKSAGIDPGRPGVPEFGRKLYHLSGEAPRRPSQSNTFLARKLRTTAGKVESHPEYQRASKELKRFQDRLSRAVIRGVVLDYDGTICGASERFCGVNAAVANRLSELCQNTQTVIGIATGRGQSVGKDLRSKLAESTWPYIHIGYYNGTQILPLNGAPFLPDTSTTANECFAGLADSIRKQAGDSVEVHERPDHISIEVTACSTSLWIRELLREEVARRQPFLKCFESSHSIDVFPANQSKRAVVTYCCQQASCGSDSILRIGDSATVTGNDFELLDSPFGLTVGEPSASLFSAWNLLPNGLDPISGTLFYLDCLRPCPDGLRFDLRQHARGSS